MTRSLSWKLTLAFLLVALMVALLMGVVLRLTNPAQLDRLIVEQQRSEFRSSLIAYYEAHGSWQGVWPYLSQQQGPPFTNATGMPAMDHSGDGGHASGPRRNRYELFGLVDAQGNVIIPLMPEHSPGSFVPAAARSAGEAILVDGQLVGTILTAQAAPGLTPEESAYLRRTYLALLLASGGAVLVALLVGVLLARTLTRPLQALTQATHRMAGGDLEQAVAVKSADEIGELAAAFNQMSRALARANEARRQMTADVAHELRTPLTVIAGYIEAMREGVLAPSPERLAVIYAEIEHLQHLVGELRTLSQADAGELKLNRQPVAPGQLLQQAQSAFEHQAAQKGILLSLSLNGDLPRVVVDEARMSQVLGNLLSNALRHTPAGGRVALGASAQGGRVTLTVHDSGSGISPEDLPFIFNRFYRGDSSRAGDGGESGLGLAIAKALVEAHGGTLEPRSTLGQGTAFHIHLPLNRA